MRTRTILVLGVALILVGAGGMLLLARFGGPSVPVSGSASVGEQIYYAGTGAEGPIPRTGGMMSGRACAGCHGEDGKGGTVRMMFSVEVPDIRYSALTSPHTEDDPPMPAWTDADIARAIRDGVEPNGKPLDSFMPRWDMSDSDMRDVISYLKELG